MVTMDQQQLLRAHRPSTSSRRYVDHIRVLPTRFCGSSTFTLSLGSICSYWREIAWSMPSLWNGLLVQANFLFRIHAKADHGPAVAALANIINQYSTRWSNLDLSMPPRCYEYFQATAPIDKSIHIS
jgi:hypothetical protein